LRQGLDFAGHSFQDEASFRKLIECLDLDQSGDISFPEFSEGLRLLLLRDLFRHTQDVPTDAVIQVMDYDTVHLERYTVCSGGGDAEREELRGSFGKVIDAKDFYFQDRPDWVQTRWIHVSGSNSATTLQQLAVLYALHPLALEDALSPESHRPKAELYSSHYFIMCPYFSIVWEPVPMEQHSRSRKWFCVLPRFLRWCLKGFPRQRRKRLCNSSPEQEDRGATQISSIHAHMASMFVITPADDTIITYVYQDSGEEHLWQRVQQDLELSYSKLRQYDAQYLAYALLDEAVDAIDPIVASVRSEVEEERELLRSTHFDSLDRIHQLKTQLNKVSQKLKPFMRLLTHVIEDDAISSGATIYLRDVLDNLEGCDEEVRQLLLACEAVDEEADKHQSRQMDQTLYTLTVISAVFLPAQFLTGVWGMNFEDMPELQRSWGYEMFWAIAIFMMLIVFIMLNFGRIRR